MGVFLRQTKPAEKPLSLPHARGGVSAQHMLGVNATWVFPTPVGVFLTEQDARDAER